VDLDRVGSLKERYAIGEDEKIILFVGRLVSVKGADRLIMAMPEILRGSKCKLVIVGTGDMQNHLLSLVRSLGLEDDVKFRFEFIPEEERILHYAACDLAVFPSLYEPFGIVCLESMSMAKPVVVGAAGISGMRETVVTSGPDQCGYHINPYDPSDIAKAALKVLKDDDHARFLGENGRRRVLKYFTWEETAKNTIQAYKEILEKGI
jgi:glycogen(starch) synthase